MRRRSPHAELAERVNVTRSLLKEGSSRDEALSVIMDRFGVSRRQAYRYIEEALRIKRTVLVPERKVVFTVKVPESLVSFIRHIADATGESLSVIVTQALKAFLKRRGYGQKGS
jgi:predicted DNA-binding transcriptional regulator YafY